MGQSKIEKLYGNDKAKGFVNHLIKAYMPISKITKVFEFKKGQTKKCNVCSQKLLSIEESLEAYRDNQEVIVNDMMSRMKEEAQAYLDKTEVKPKTDNPIVKHVAKGRVLAFTGEKTDTCLCFQCSQDLLEMVQSGLLMDDKNIVYQVNQIQRNQFFNRFDENPELTKHQKETAKEIKKRVDKKKTATLGDLGVLQQLKEQMEKDKK